MRARSRGVFVVAVLAGSAVAMHKAATCAGAVCLHAVWPVSSAFPEWMDVHAGGDARRRWVRGEVERLRRFYYQGVTGSGWLAGSWTDGWYSDIVTWGRGCEEGRRTEKGGKMDW